MTEKDIQKRFCEFLLNSKGFSKDSLWLNAPLSLVGSRRHIADLLLLDTDNHSYLAMVEFSQELKEDAKLEIKSYLEVLGSPTVPVYVVVSDDAVEAGFSIYTVNQETWLGIDFDEFPSYEMLKSKNQADEKIENLEATEKTAKVKERRKEFIKSTAWTSILSLIVGTVTVVYFTLGNFNKKKDNVLTDLTNDSLSLEQSRSHEKVLALEVALKKAMDENKIRPNSKMEIEVVQLRGKVDRIENIIDKNPERLLKIQELNFQLQDVKDEVESQKELSELHMQNLKEKIDELALWTSGLIITIFGSIISLVVNAIRKT